MVARSINSPSSLNPASSCFYPWAVAPSRGTAADRPGNAADREMARQVPDVKAPFAMGRRAKTRLTVAVCGLLAVSFSSAVAEKVISQGDTWRFHNGVTFPGATWNTNGYDDTVAGWFSFPSGFGYGDGDDATVLADMQNGYAAFFTRKAFVIDDPGAVNYLTLSVDYDDGFVTFINGKEVARSNVVGAVTNTLFAAGNHEASIGNGDSNPQEKAFITLNPSDLVAGTNVIAVSCHNVTLTSSDASLIIELYTNVTLVRG